MVLSWLRHECKCDATSPLSRAMGWFWPSVAIGVNFLAIAMVQRCMDADDRLCDHTANQHQPCPSAATGPVPQMPVALAVGFGTMISLGVPTMHRTQGTPWLNLCRREFLRR